MIEGCVLRGGAAKASERDGWEEGEGRRVRGRCSQRTAGRERKVESVEGRGKALDPTKESRKSLRKVGGFLLLVWELLIPFQLALTNESQR